MVFGSLKINVPYRHLLRTMRRAICMSTLVIMWLFLLSPGELSLASDDLTMPGDKQKDQHGSLRGLREYAAGPIPQAEATAPNSPVLPPAALPVFEPYSGPAASIQNMTAAAAYNPASTEYPTGNTASVEAANTVDPNLCSYTNCGLVTPESCPDYTNRAAAALGYINYLDQGTTYCAIPPWRHSSCCGQTCETDTDCPSQYHCQSGYPNGSQFCRKCDTCSTTSVSKCKNDQNCWSCCLSEDQRSCGLGNFYFNMVIDGNVCCPSRPASFRFSQNPLSCSCGSQQNCPAAPSPPPPPTRFPPPPPSPPPPFGGSTSSRSPGTPQSPSGSSGSTATTTITQGQSSDGTAASCFPTSAMVYTPSGSKTMGEVKIGEKVSKSCACLCLWIPIEISRFCTAFLIKIMEVIAFRQACQVCKHAHS